MAKTNTKQERANTSTITKRGQAGGQAPHRCRGRQCSSSTQTNTTTRSTTSKSSQSRGNDNQDLILEIFLDDIG